MVASVRQGECRRSISDRNNIRLALLDVHLGETGRVPQLVDEAAVAVNALLIHPDFTALRSKGGQREAKDIGAVLLNHIQRINDIAR